MNNFASKLANSGYYVYETSLEKASDSEFAIVSCDNKKYLAVSGKLAERFCGKEENGVKICEQSPENAKVLHTIFSYTKPQRLPKKGFSLGLGDRTATSTPGLARALKNTNAFPIFAQQSTRELNLTGRSFDDVVAAASFAVLEAGYKTGYAADGDHLKNIDEIRPALSAGCTLITLDCSEHIKAEYLTCENEKVHTDYIKLPVETRTFYEQKYLNRAFPVIGKYSEIEFRRTVLAYENTIAHIEACADFIKNYADHDVDIELSIDETSVSTVPSAHFFVANELADKKIELWSCAPRFIGKFEKGVDYIGDVREFEQDFILHQCIAEHFGYKMSVHSGSDKLSIYPIVARETKGNVHVKTSGTWWLEATRLLSVKAPELFRKTFLYSIECLPKAKQLYSITTNMNDIPNIDEVSDEKLPEYLEANASRQLLHVSYGYLLQEPWFAKGLTEAIFGFESDYHALINTHIGKHLKAFQ